MRNAFATLLQEARPSLSSCPVCPVKGDCVFWTPEYEPGYCLHEYKQLHAFLANRLRAHPPAGAAGFSRLVQQLVDEASRLRTSRGFDPARLRAGLASFNELRPSGLQATLGEFGP